MNALPLAHSRPSEAHHRDVITHSSLTLYHGVTATKQSRKGLQNNTRAFHFGWLWPHLPILVQIVMVSSLGTEPRCGLLG